MNNNSVIKLGSAGAILAGVSYILIGLTFFLDPTEQANSPAEFFTIFAENPTLHLLGHWAFGLAGVFMLATIPALARTVQAANEGWVRWTSTLATIGFALTAIGHFRAAANDLIGARAFVAGDAVAQTAIVEAARLGTSTRRGGLHSGEAVSGFWLSVSWRCAKWCGPSP